MRCSAWRIASRIASCWSWVKKSQIANPAEDSYVPGQAMAAAQGIAARPAWAAEEDGGGVAALREALESETEDRGGRRPPG